MSENRLYISVGARSQSCQHRTTAMQRTQSATAVTTDTVDSIDQFDSEIESPPVAETPKLTVVEISAERLKRLAKSSLIMDKPDPTKRSFNKDYAAKLSESIASEGLLHPPIVEDNGDGTYNVKSGRHRVYACLKLLAWTEIPCFVFSRGEDNLAESVEIAANLFVSPLNEPQTRRAIERYRELYLARNGNKKTARGTVKQRDGFAKELEAIKGVSPAQADRLATTAKMISSEDRDTLEKAGVKQSAIDNIAQLREPEAVKTAVALAAAGTAPEEAVREGKKVKEKKKAAKAAAKPKANGKPDAEPNAEPVRKATDMTDDEWLTTHCGKILEALPFKSAFRRDAILYRRISDKVIGFRTATKKALGEAKKPGENGQFFANIFRIVRASHPMNWLICDGCNGTGHVPDDKTKSCTRCLGGGYKVKFEET